MNGPLGDSDWWENDDGDGDDAESDACSETFREEECALSRQPRSEEEEEEEEAGGVDFAPHPNFRGNANRRFTNRGRQTWCLARAAWVAAGRGSGNELVKSPPIPPPFKKELVRCLGDRRHFELSQRIALGCVIDAYQEVWADGSSE